MTTQLAALALVLALAGCATTPEPRPVAYAPPPPGPIFLAISHEAAFQHLMNAMVTQSIPIENAVKDAGLIRTGKVVTRNINRTSAAIAIGCGLSMGARAAPQIECLDFIAEYQFLIQPDSLSTSRVTISANVQAVNIKGFPAGIVSNPHVVGRLVDTMRQHVMAGIPTAARPATTIDPTPAWHIPVTTEFSCPMGSSKVGSGCVADSRPVAGPNHSR